MFRRQLADYDEPEPDYYDDEVSEPRRRRIGGRKATAGLLLFALAFLGFAVLRVLGIDGNPFLVAAMAATPYVAAGGAALGLLTFLLRRRVLAAVVLLFALSLGVLLLPRMFSGEQPGADGPRLRLMTANLDSGQADAATIVNVVRANQVDVLSLPELTQAAVAALDEAGLAAELPHRVFDPGVGTHGAGIASRYPLRQIVLIETSTLSEPSAVVDLPGRDDVEIVAVHLPPPGEAWRRELAELPTPRTQDRARPRVLAGDFNATLDHAMFRGVLDRGYADAADQTGHGLAPTWTDWRFGPPSAVDHVLVDRSCAVATYSVVDLPGSDHHAVLAEIVLP